MSANETSDSISMEDVENNSSPYMTYAEKKKLEDAPISEDVANTWLEKKGLKNIKSLHTLMKGKIVKPKFIIQDLIPELGVTMVYGDQESFKSFVVLHLAIALSQGTLFLNHFETEKKNVLYIDEENNLVRTKYRAMQIVKGHNVDVCEDENLNLTQYNNYKLDLGDGVEYLKATIKHFDPDVIVIDSLRRCMMGDENASKDANFMYDTMKEIMLSRGKPVSIIVIHHKNRSGGFRGSSDLLAAPDYSYELTKLTSNLIKVTPIKVRDLNRDFLEYFNIQVEDTEIIEETDVVPGETPNGIEFTWILREDGDGSSDNPIDRCADEIMKYVTENELTEFKSSEMVKEMEVLDHSRDNYYKAMKKLQTISKLRTDKKNIYNVIP